MKPDQLAILTAEERLAFQYIQNEATHVEDAGYTVSAECIYHNAKVLAATIAALRTQLAAERVAYTAVETERNEAVRETDALRAELAVERLAVDRLSKFCEASIVSCSYEYCPVYDAGCDRGRDTNCHEVLTAWALAQAKAQKDGVTG
jgi:hypothetical protein